ncbi:DUF6079 family protein [Sphingopyxis sp. EG6]|uniref:DUF6079 family protein n=1 Tax=Sphingopyxis sp. EG6 TaxID=1874061 RepID=UPI000DC63063|nr:DUF6079 family protein [Sphingopyxis sp. EG6]BBB08719.1 VrlK [Sphingopyxis sp. EG6]
MIDHVMAAAEASRMLEATGAASGKPILLVGDEANRSATLAAMSVQTSTTPLNLGIELSQALIDATGARLSLSAAILSMRPSDPILLLDRIQILMLPQLKVNVLDTLVRVARRRPVSARMVWAKGFSVRERADVKVDDTVNFREYVNAAAGFLLAPHFEEVYPEYKRNSFQVSSSRAT